MNLIEQKSISIGLDATNLKAGGGLTHLKQILNSFESDELVINVVGGSWIEKISDNPAITLEFYKDEFSNVFKQEIFKKFKLPTLLYKSDIIYTPGGSFSTKKKPYVTMSRNMLVFEENERNRFPKSFNWLRYIILEKLQLKSFKNSKGIIYISHYAKNYIENKYPFLKSKNSTVIYHGISDQFRNLPKVQKEISECTFKKPFKLLYVSIINFYKHQWNVIEAVKMLRNEGFPVTLELIGPMNEPCRAKFEKSLLNSEEFINYLGKVDYAKISASYKNTDLFIFASTCENMPNILVEAMSAGLPILSSSYGPMPEILKDGGNYMDPVNVESIYVELKKMLLNSKNRDEMAKKAYEYSQDFSWDKTANKTFDFIKNVYSSQE